MCIQLVQFVKNKISIQLMMLIATLGNFALFGIIECPKIISWQTNFCSKCSNEQRYEIILNHYNFLVLYVLIMFLGWLVFCRFPRIGVIIEFLPSVVFGSLLSFALIWDYVL